MEPDELTLVLSKDDVKLLQEVQVVLKKLLKKKQHRKGKAALLYVLDEGKYHATDGATLRGQKTLVIRSMVELGAIGNNGRTRKEIFENSKETSETSRPTVNAVGQIITYLQKAGIVHVLNPRKKKS